MTPVYPASQSIGAPVRKPKGGSSMLGSILLGGSIGCGMLVLLVAIIAFVISSITAGDSELPTALTPDITTPDSVGTGDLNPTVSMTRQPTDDIPPALDPTSEAARETLIARNISRPMRL